MAESSQTSGIDEQLFGAKDEHSRESTPKTKSGKEATKTQPKGHLESEFKGQESSYFASDKKNSVDNSEMKMAGKREIVEGKEADETATGLEESTSQDSEKIATTEETAKENTNKESQGEQDTQITQDLKSNEKQTFKPDQANSSKKGRLSFRRSKKGKISKRKTSLEEEKRVEILKCETIEEDPKIVEERAKEICDEPADKANEAKFETVESTMKIENKEPFTSPEGVQDDKSTATDNKGLNMKQFPSFRRTTKGKYTFSQSVYTDACDGHRQPSEKFESSEDPQKMAIEETSSKIPVVANKGESNEQEDEKEETVDLAKKETSKQKKKVTVLSFKRNKPSLKKPKGKSIKKDEGNNSEINPSTNIDVGKETDDISVMDGDALRKQADFKEKSPGNGEEHKLIAMEDEQATAEEKSGSVEEKQGDSLEEEKNSTEKEDDSAKAHEATRQLSLKKKKKENILRRSFRKFTNPSSALQGKKKSKGDEKTANADMGVTKKIDEEDKSESSGLEESVDVQSVARKENEEKLTECEENSKAVKRKKELTDSNRELKKQKEDDETEIQDKDALGETAGAVVVELKQDTKTTDAKSNVVDDLENVTTKELDQKKEKNAGQLNCKENNELSPQENNTNEQKEVKAEVEIPEETLVRKDKQIETSAKAEGGHVVEVRVVIDEQAKKDKQATHEEESKGSSDDGNTFTEIQGFTGIQRQMSETRSEGRHRHLDGYDSDLTVVTALAYPFTEDDELSESDTSGTDANTEDDETQAIAEVHVIPPETKTSRVDEALENTNTDPDTEDEEVRVINEGVSSDKGVLRDGNEGSEKLVIEREHEAITPTQSNELERTLTPEEERALNEDKRSKNGSAVQSLQSSCQNPAEEWIMVHRLDITEEIARRLMTVLTPICRLRRNAACCTVM
ncbi:myosin-2 heavy chain-like isoform X1 [Stylophora pistillata]|uniref:myosin-2 heavy chain-like isoform X1 n=1 Tax=Stylophora pistillata TaxID=50429 RepID=UPI000C05253F|nr:myosin-2 heavy chain-like isoform X1 [Stylophora pistillata]